MLGSEKKSYNILFDKSTLIERRTVKINKDLCVKTMNYRMVEIRSIHSQGLGSLSFFESGRDMSFEIKRIYYITGVPANFKRGYHAHKTLKQLLFCPYGSIEIILDDGERKESIILNDSSKGLIIEEPLWREMTWIVKESVLCVAASDYYDQNDYIRDYNSFRVYRSQMYT